MKTKEPAGMAKALIDAVLRPASASPFMSESARMASAAQARFRIDAPNSKPRQVKVIALDGPSEAVVKDLAERHWQNASFFTASAFSGTPPGRDFSIAPWLADLAGRTRNLIDEVSGADLVVMIATAGLDAQAASLIGEACSLKRVDTTGLILGSVAASDEALSKTLSRLRPWSLMLVIANGADYIEDMLIALRA
jgi:hypothetical protein